MRRSLLCLLASAISLVLGMSTASASPLFELVGDTSGVSGLNGRSVRTGAGSAAAYFNPALLTYAERGIELSTFFLYDDIRIDLEPRRDSGDVPVGFRGSIHEGSYTVNGENVNQPTVIPDSIPTSWLEDGCPVPNCSPDFAARPRGGAGTSQNVRGYQSIGLVEPVFDDLFTVGFHAMIPIGDFTTADAFFVDEREQFFSNSLHAELYGDRLTATSLAFGIGVPLLDDRLSLGASATISLANTADAGTFVSDSDNQAETLQLSTEVGVQAAVSPHFGVAFEALDGWMLTATFHTAQRFDIDTGFSALLPNGNEQEAERSATHNYLPWNLGLGTSYELTLPNDDLMTFTGTITFARWFNYIDRQSNRPQQGYEWSDTITPVLGARYMRGPWRTFLDFTFQPSPVPEQTGRTNYVDNDRFTVSSGFDFTFDLGSDNALRFGLNTQLHGLFGRSHAKIDAPVNPVSYDRDDAFGEQHYPQLVIDEVPDDATDGQSRRGESLDGRVGLQTNNPGWPGYDSSGLLFGGGITIALIY